MLLHTKLILEARYVSTAGIIAGKIRMIYWQLERKVVDLSHVRNCAVLVPFDSAIFGVVIVGHVTLGLERRTCVDHAELESILRRSVDPKMF